MGTRLEEAQLLNDHLMRQNGRLNHSLLNEMNKNDKLTDKINEFKHCMKIEKQRLRREKIKLEKVIEELQGLKDDPAMLVKELRKAGDREQHEQCMQIFSFFKNECASAMRETRQLLFDAEFAIENNRELYDLTVSFEGGMDTWFDKLDNHKSWAHIQNDRNYDRVREVYFDENGVARGKYIQLYITLCNFM